MNEDLLARLVEDADALSDDDWVAVESELAADPAQRRRLVRSLVMDQQLAQCLGQQASGVAAAVRERVAALAGPAAQGGAARSLPRRRGRRGDHARRLRPRARSRNTLIALVLVAAVVLVSLLVASPQTQPLDPVAAPAVAQAPQGPSERRGPGRVVLAGAVADLDAAALLHIGPVPSLVTGRAVFTVEPHAASDPFVLALPQGSITVLGTRFTVGITDDDTAVGVEHGRVRLSSGTRSVELDAGSRATLTPDGQLSRSRRFLEVDLVAADGDDYAFSTQATLVEGPEEPELAAIVLSPGYSGVRVIANAPRSGSLPGQRVLIRYRVLREVEHVSFQCWNIEQQNNFGIRVRSTPGVWHEVEIPLAALEPHKNSEGPWRSGDTIGNLKLASPGEEGDVLRVAEVAFTVPQ